MDSDVINWNILPHTGVKELTPRYVKVLLYMFIILWSVLHVDIGLLPGEDNQTVMVI